MKLKSLILGSVAAAGLSTAGFAADLGVLTSLDVCDSLGLSGLTISSDTNCLQITGGVSYEFNWGDYRSNARYSRIPTNPYSDNPDDGANDFPVEGSTLNPLSGDFDSADYESKVDAWLKVVGTADSDFGPARAVLGFHQLTRYRTRDAGWASTDDTTPVAGYFGQGLNSDSTNGLELSEAYVRIGDTTVLTAGVRVDGKDGSVGNFDDDTPFNYLSTFGSQVNDGGGILFKNGAYIFGGASIQVQSDLGNGVSVGVGLENIDNTDGNESGGRGILRPSVQRAEYAGTLLGVVNYAGDGVSAHLTAGAIGVLDGNVESWFAHTGATAAFDNFKIRAALGYLRDDTYGLDLTAWQGVITGEATFDMFTLALTGEYSSTENGTSGFAPINNADGFGFGASISAAVTDAISLNLGGRYFKTTPDGFADFDQWQVEAQIVAAVTETLKASAGVGVYGGDVVEASLAVPALSGDDTAYYGSLGAVWTPTKGFETSVKGLVTSEGAYKATFKATKSFE